MFFIPLVNITFTSKNLGEMTLSFLNFCIQIRGTLITVIIVSSVGRGRGNAGTSPRPRNPKNCCRNLVLSSRVYTFGAEPEIEEIFSKYCEKSQFSIEILIKKSQSFLEIFQNSLHFWSKCARFCIQVAYFYLPNRNHSSNLDDLAFF